MRQVIQVKHVNDLKSAKAKISETGDISHEIAFDVLLAPGDFERLLLMFKQRIPVEIEISSPQSKMDLKFELITDQNPGRVDRFMLHGAEIPREEALNEDGTLKDGVVYMWTGPHGHTSLETRGFTPLKEAAPA